MCTYLQLHILKFINKIFIKGFMFELQYQMYLLKEKTLGSSQSSCITLALFVVYKGNTDIMQSSKCLNRESKGLIDR